MKIYIFFLWICLSIGFLNNSGYYPPVFFIDDDDFGYYIFSVYSPYFTDTSYSCRLEDEKDE